MGTGKNETEDTNDAAVLLTYPEVVNVSSFMKKDHTFYSNATIQYELLDILGLKTTVTEDKKSTEITDYGYLILEKINISKPISTNYSDTAYNFSNFISDVLYFDYKYTNISFDFICSKDDVNISYWVLNSNTSQNATDMVHFNSASMSLEASTNGYVLNTDLMLTIQAEYMNYVFSKELNLTLRGCNVNDCSQ